MHNLPAISKIDIIFQKEAQPIMRPKILQLGIYYNEIEFFKEE